MLVLGFAVALGLSLVFSQPDVGFRWPPNSATPYEGQTVILEVAFPASAAAIVEPPRVDGAEIVMISDSPIAPDRRRQEFAIVPRRAGFVIVPAFRVKIGDRAVSSGSYRLNVKPVSAVGRPSTFLGGVGDLKISVQVDGDSPVRTNESIEGRIRIDGPGALGINRFPDLSSWRRAGVEWEWGRMTSDGSARILPLRLRIPPRSDDAATLPAISISWFDPVSKRFFARSSERVRLQVKPLPGFEPDAFRYGVETRANAERPWTSTEGKRWLFAAALLVAALLITAVRFNRAHRLRRTSDPRRQVVLLLRELQENVDSYATAEALARRIASGFEPILGGVDLSGSERERAAAAIWGQPLGREARELIERCERARFSTLVDDAAALHREAVRVLNSLARKRGWGSRRR